MHFNVSQLMMEPSGSTRAYEVDEDVSLAHDDNVKRVSGAVKLLRTDRGVWVSARLDSAVVCSCSRCLKEYRQPVQMSIEEESFSSEEPGVADEGAGTNVVEVGEESATIDQQHILDLERGNSTVFHAEHADETGVPGQLPGDMHQLRHRPQRVLLPLRRESCRPAMGPVAGACSHSATQIEDPFRIMPPLPKKKHSKGRQGKRAAHHGLRAPSVARCPQCRSAKLPHRVCPTCGYYNGREVVPVEISTGPQA